MFIPVAVRQEHCPRNLTMLDNGSAFLRPILRYVYRLLSLLWPSLSSSSQSQLLISIKSSFRVYSGCALSAALCRGILQQEQIVTGRYSCHVTSWMYPTWLDQRPFS
ncbi:hypothetical protein M404DRAFT_443159 [Pisolithus tinctorius Marx 270]|uniref:Uncharacterized protein n=1 Tax=Pisolithus tinctorius Marx 270 TaxID=870435 RepID=A0A0C3ND85_PISTI|nr:hypothetical protein M404DRAFT_443159 [Pisolithus tinctorius Marx 270]